MKFLLIDDSAEIFDAVSLCLNLRWPQAEVIGSSTGEEGLALVEQQAPDMVVLDIGLPDMTGLAVLKAIRDFSDVPIVMLTARDQDVEVARYLEAGADDYVVKPFSHVELLGRIQAVFRRARGRGRVGSASLRAGDLVLDFDAAEVHKAGEPVSFTRTELNLLQELVRNATRVVTYESLAAKVLHAPEPADSDTRVIKVHVQHIRSKLGDSADQPRYIANVYGVGYKFLLPASAAIPAGATE